MKENVILQEYFDSVETEEQDLELYNQFFTDEEMEYDYPSFIYVNDHNPWSEGDPILIEDLQKHLDDAKKLGATHVELMHHTDHHSYVITPCLIRKATKEEIEAETKRNEESIKEKKREHIKNLQREIERLENEIQ